MTDTFEGLRPLDPRETIGQINRMTLLGISGGRWSTDGKGSDVYRVNLPVSNGYRVVIELAANDTYTVKRVFKRGDKEWVRGTLAGVYFDRLSEVAYYASCFRSYDEHTWTAKA